MFVQKTRPDTGAEDGFGWCLRQTQSVFSAPVKYATAREAWDNQRGRHAGELPPKGVSVPIWLDHWGSYGVPAKWGNFGHAATSLPDGRVLTSPLLNKHLNRWDPVKGEMVGSAIYPSIQALQKDIGGSPTYLGWSEYMNGKQIVSWEDPTLEEQEEDEDMWKPTVHLRVDEKGKFIEGTLAHPEIGLDVEVGAFRTERTSAGEANVYRGFKASANKAVVASWQTAYAKGPGTATTPGEKDKQAYFNMQSSQQQMSIDLFGVDGRDRRA